MFDKRLLVTSAAVVLVSAVAIVAALLPEQLPEEIVPLQEPVSGVAISSLDAPPEPEPDYLYLMREYEGRVAVFGQDPDNPELILEKLVRHLPDYDQIQMREGIEIYSFEELSARIEDYIS